MLPPTHEALADVGRMYAHKLPSSNSNNALTSGSVPDPVQYACQQNFTITREEQQDVVLDFTRPYLEHFLKKNTAAWALARNPLPGYSRILA